MTAKILTLTPLIVLVFTLLLVVALIGRWFRKSLETPLDSTDVKQQLLSRFILVSVTFTVAFLMLSVIYNALFYGVLMVMHGEDALTAIKTVPRSTGLHFSTSLRFFPI